MFHENEVCSSAGFGLVRVPAWKYGQTETALVGHGNNVTYGHTWQYSKYFAHSAPCLSPYMPFATRFLYMVSLEKYFSKISCLGPHDPYGQEWPRIVQNG